MSFTINEKGEINIEMEDFGDTPLGKWTSKQKAMFDMMVAKNSPKGGGGETISISLFNEIMVKGQDMCRSFLGDWFKDDIVYSIDVLSSSSSGKEVMFLLKFKNPYYKLEQVV